MGFLDVSRSNGGLSISGCIGQLSCLTIFSTSLSVAAFLRRAGSSMLEHWKPWERCRTEGTRDETHGRVQLYIDLTCVTRLGRSILLLNSKAPEQMSAKCWHWRPRWNRLASSTSCFGSSACLQSSSSVLCKTAYGSKVTLR